jgi:hypothetical protein
LGLNQAQITAYNIQPIKADATPVEVHGRCLFGFDGQIQIALTRNAPAQEEFTLIQTSAAGGPTIDIDFGTFGRTIYVYGGPLVLTVWANTNGLN